MQRLPRYFLPAALLVCFVFGGWLRIDHIVAQVLSDDEWHPVHQLIYYSPGHIAGTFGNADYSIPLVLFYWLEMKWFGVSELTLRMPMIVAGLATMIAMPLALRNRFVPSVVIIFAALLALSPFVISYARIGRSYAVTLLGVYLAYWCFERTLQAIREGISFPRSAFAYAVLCGLMVWTHPIAGPMLVAPLFALWLTNWRRHGIEWQPLIQITLITGLTMSLAVLPPLLGDPQALAGKSGLDQITLETAYGALFLWFGTGSPAVVAISLLFVAAGAPVVLRALPIARWATIGLLLTAAALLISKPWWVDRPLAFARYLLPAVPLLLLMVSAGIVRLSDALLDAVGLATARPVYNLAFAAPFILFSWYVSPMPEILASSSSYTQNSYYQYDYRKESNPVRIGMGAMPQSNFWQMLAAAPPQSITVAVAPFHYATYDWPAPLWERDSHQRIIPAYIWGTCEDTVHGEVPPDARFRFRNGAHMKSRAMLLEKQVDYLAYYRRPVGEGYHPPLPKCEAWMRQYYGPPSYEDQALVVWRIRQEVPTAITKKRNNNRGQSAPAQTGK